MRRGTGAGRTRGGRTRTLTMTPPRVIPAAIPMALAKGPGPSRGGMVASGGLRARREVPRRRALATRFSSFKNPLFARNPVERFSGSRLKVSRAPVSGKAEMSRAKPRIHDESRGFSPGLLVTPQRAGHDGRRRRRGRGRQEASRGVCEQEQRESPARGFLLRGVHRCRQQGTSRARARGWNRVAITQMRALRRENSPS